MTLATHQRSVSEIQEYETLENSVMTVLSGIHQHPNYRFRPQYGGRFDDHERTFVTFESGKSLRSRHRTQATLQVAKAELDADGRFGSVIHYMRAAGDHILVVQLGATPVL